jgi:hypothetical protein
VIDFASFSTLLHETTARHTNKMAHQTTHKNPSSQHARLKDFSVESQRRTFIAEQERERAALENRRSSRRLTKAASSNNTIAISGITSHLDDDDSVGSCSVGSEESFYVGIERADYTSPNNLEMYGEAEDFVEKEDRLGIGRVNVVEICENIVPVHEESSTLHQFMTGRKKSDSQKDVLVAMPLVVNGLQYKSDLIIEEDHTQVYQQQAAEGKMFINKLVGNKSSDEENASTVADVVNQPTEATPAKRLKNPIATSGAQRTMKGRGHYPVITPTALLSPYMGQVSNCEDNTMRQLREREIRKDASDEAKRQYDVKLNKLQEILGSLSEDGFSASEMKKQMEDILKDG